MTLEVDQSRNNQTAAILRFIGMDESSGVQRVSIKEPFFTRGFWGFAALFPKLPMDTPGEYLLISTDEGHDIASFPPKILALELAGEETMFKISGNTVQVRKALERNSAQRGLPSIVLAIGDLSYSQEGIVLYTIQGVSTREAMKVMREKAQQAIFDAI